MSESQHTPGPWRWEVNEKSKSVELCGGKPMYDLTVMDFERWGMQNSAPRFRDNSDHGLLHRCIKWAKMVLGRERHAHWFKRLDHPDAHLIAAAPDLLIALENMQCVCPECGGDGKETCTNPDHGLIVAVGGETGRLGCPVCGHDEHRKVKNGGPCLQCDGKGSVTLKVAIEYCGDDFSEIMRHYSDKFDELDAARAAIAKARGGNV